MGVYSLNQSTGYRVSRLAREMELHLEAKLETIGLTRLGWCVLAAIDRSGCDTPSKIAEKTGLYRPNVTRALTVFERDGLLSRCSSAEDGRSRIVALTDKGHRLTDVAAHMSKDTNAHFLAKLSSCERETLNALIDKLLETEAGELRRI